MLLIAAALVALVVILSGVALYLFDVETLREPLQTQASAALGRDAKLGEISLSLFPLPAVRVADIRIAGPKPSDPPFAEIEELRLRVAILPLLARQVVLRSLEIDSPRVHIPFDKAGKPILPGPAKAKAKPAPSDAEKPGEPEAEEASAAPALAVDRISIDGARVEAGPWLIENGSVAGHLSLDGSGSFRVALDLPGIGELRNTELELAGLTGATPEIGAQGEFFADLTPLAKRFALSQEISGRARGEFEVGLAGAELRTATVNIDVPDLLVRSGDLVVSGPARAHAVLGESYSIDLSDTRVEKTGLFAKPKRTPLSVTGTLGKEPDLSAVREALVKIGTNVIPLGLELERRPMRVHVRRSAIDLASLRELLPPDRPPLAGRFHVDGLDVQIDPLRVTGNAALDNVETKLEHGPIRVSGPVRGTGKQIVLENGSAVVGEQTIAIDATYDLESGAIAARYDTANSQLGALVAALSGRSEVDGTLSSQGQLTAPTPDLNALAGTGRIDIRPGRIQGFSLVKSLMGSLSSLPGIAAAASGKDLSRYDDERFERLTADYRIAGGRVSTENLELAYQNATAFLHGSVGMSDRSLDLAGRVVLSKEADADLAGAKRARERVIPIAHITGTLDAPRVELDQKTLAALALAYTGNDKTREKLDKALGPGASEAVEDLLGNILGGKKK
ncbi:MAG: AsmA family protein [Myxococcota bacterium]